MQETQIVERKDRNKDAFFWRNISKLPAEIQEQYNHAALKDKRSLVNGIVHRLPDGSWAFNLKAKVVREWLERYSEHEMQKGLVTQSPGRAALIWGGWAALSKAVKRGEVMELQWPEGKRF